MQQSRQLDNHVPDTLGEVLFQPFADGNINVSAKLAGQFRSVPEGIWVQGGGLEIPCFYGVFVKQPLPELKNSLKEKLSVLNHNANGTA